MTSPKNIPNLNSDEFWKRFINTDQPLTDFFRAQPETFLITRFEEAKHLLKLPIAPHRRDVNEILFVTKGNTVRGSNLNQITISAGELHLHLGNQISTTASISDDCEGFYCHFNMETITKLYHKEHMVNELAMLSAHMKTKAVCLNKATFASVKAIFERLLLEYRTNNDLNLIDAYLVALCYEIKNSLLLDNNQSSISKAHDLTEQFKTLLTRYIYEQQTVSFYAQELNISPNHLNKIVKQTTGKQASALIADMLILEAKVLLKHTQLSISEITYKLKFEDQSYFSRFFKKHTGNTPKSYRMSK